MTNTELLEIERRNIQALKICNQQQCFLDITDLIKEIRRLKKIITDKGDNYEI